MSRPARWRQSARGLPHHWAGAYTCWGRENREAALRFVRGTVERAANLELKVIDSANPYLAAACLIGAGLAGLDDGLELPPPLVRDPADISVEERETLGVRRLSADLGEAIEAFNRSSVAPKVLGETLYQAFDAVRRFEWNLYRGPSPKRSRTNCDGGTDEERADRSRLGAHPARMSQHASVRRASLSANVT